MTDTDSLRQIAHSRAPFSAWFGTMLLFCLFGAIVFALIGPAARRDHYEESRAQKRSENLKTLREADAKALNGYAWVDKAKGTVHVPIERAMQLTLLELSQKKPAVAYPIATPAAAAPSAAPSAPPKNSPAPAASAQPAASTAPQASPAAPSNKPAASPSAAPNQKASPAASAQPAASAAPQASPAAPSNKPAGSPGASPNQKASPAPSPAAGQTPAPTP